jgi:hypothetical protein
MRHNERKSFGGYMAIPIPNGIQIESLSVSELLSDMTLLHTKGERRSCTPLQQKRQQSTSR